MKILWFTGNGAIYSNTNRYNGGGWVGALANEILKKYPNLELGMAIPWKYKFKDERNGVKFYGISPIKFGIINYKHKLNKQIRELREIVEDFQPDIIHEHNGGMVCTVTDIPVVIHLQGILNYLIHGWLPQNLSWEKFLFWNPREWTRRKAIIRNCETEKIIFSSCHYFMGRTEMDFRMSRFLSPNSNYFFCSEMLRPQIYFTKSVWVKHENRKKKKIISIISPAIYKGGDIILRAAQALKTYTNIDFEWNVYGINSMKNWEKLTSISPNSVNVNIKGIINETSLIEEIINSDVFVHPSYIENSPNTVCEAQLIGIPVIANNTGGIPSLIKNNENGILVPTNDIFAVAEYIQKIVTDLDFAEKIGKNGREVALLRHNPNQIIKDVLTIYTKILN
jgi:glycosyltransferase involved in cell wall biosynthesis